VYIWTSQTPQTCLWSRTASLVSQDIWTCSVILSSCGGSKSRLH
jgi:hypothetical protein